MDSRRPAPHQIPISSPNSNSSIPVMGYGHQHQHQHSPSSPSTIAVAAALKLPLAAIDRIRSNPNTPLRRGSSIFSPASQHLHIDPTPPPHPQPISPHPSTDPDPPPPPLPPPSTILSDASHSSTPPPPPPPQPPRPPPPPPPGIKYRECLKNHAAAMGGHVVDGCGEFMPSTPDSLLCAACDCHRNFHRKETDSTHHGGQINYSVAPPHLRHRHKQTVVSASEPHQVNFGAESSSEDLNIVHSGGTASGSASKKRYRTKFSQRQKDAMEKFAAKLGWRIQKECEEEVQRFCADVGVARQVFKVWMHNNKQAIKRRQS